MQAERGTKKMDDELTEKIIGAAFRVHGEMGFGFLESVYEKALSIELGALGIAHQTQHRINVFYRDQCVGEFVSDLFVESRLLVELKSVREIAPTHELQLVNYLVATRIDIGLLVNFGPSKVDIRRKYRNYCKSSR